MPAIHPVSLRDIPQDFAKLYIQHELLSSKARQQGISYIIENYIQDVRIEKSYAKADKRRWSLMVGRCYRSQRKSEKPHANVILASNKATNKAVADLALAWGADRPPRAPGAPLIKIKS